MIGRRALLQAFGGSAGLAAFKAPPPTLLQMQEHISTGSASRGALGNTVPSDVISNGYRAIRRLHQLQEDRWSFDPSRMPAEIASKRSWSPAFKESCAREYHNQIRQMIDALEHNEELANRVAKAVFG